MKAVCLLLVVAAAQHAAGSIFRHHRFNNLMVQPLEYINQFQYQNPENLPRNYEQQIYEAIPAYPLTYDKQRLNEQNSQELQQNVQNFLLQNSVDPQVYQLHEQTDDAQLKRNVRSQQVHQPMAAISSEIDTEEQLKEFDNEMYVKPRYAGVKRKLPMFASMSTRSGLNNQAVHGDIISWNGIRLAAGPKALVASEDDIADIYRDAFQTVKHITKEEQTRIHHALQQALQTNNEDVHMNATQLLKKNNYHVQEHTVQTDDGYLLGLIRIAAEPISEKSQPRPVVLMMHGILGSADDWLLMGPENSLAYLLVNAGYDVWLGNIRGNKYSRRHVSKHPALPEFWQFNNDDIALHDLPAMINYILKVSQQHKLSYIGHSQGATIMLALLAARPQYNQKINRVIAMSPMVYMSNVRSPLLRMIAANSKLSEHMNLHLGDGEFMPSQELVHTAGGQFCENEFGCKVLCSNINFVMSGVSENLEADMIPVIMGHVPAGASARLLKQFAQGVSSRDFRMYDYGSQMNQKVYGSVESPKYNLSAVTVPVSLYYSEADWLAHPKDVQRLQKELPHVKESYQVPDASFGHMDFQFSRQAPKLVYQRLIDSLKNSGLDI